MNVLIIADSPELDLTLPGLDLEAFDLLILTDGAALRAPPSGRPTIICGDFDSIDLTAARLRHPGAQFVHLSEQSTNDLEKALKIACDRGATQVIFAGALGGRLDQTLATVSIMIRHHARVAIVAFGVGSKVRIASAQSSSLVFATGEGDGVSILPQGEHAVVSAKNVQWPLDRDVLAAGSRGVSNRSLGGDVVISVSEGIVVVCHDVVPEKEDEKSAPKRSR